MEAGSSENFQKQIENGIQSISMPDGNKKNRNVIAKQINYLRQKKSNDPPLSSVWVISHCFKWTPIYFEVTS